MLSDRIYSIRQQYHYSQEKFAEKLGVSRQAVQRWENGTSVPDIGSIINIATTFNVSSDWLMEISDQRTTEEIRLREVPIPSYHKVGKWSWNSYAPYLMIDFKQGLSEGKDIEHMREIVTAVSRYKQDENKEALSDVLYKMMYTAPQVSGYAYNEPDDLQAIRLLRMERAAVNQRNLPEESVIYKKLKGAWLGRVCGCMLGQPIECIGIDDLAKLLKATDNYPMHRYITHDDVMHPIAEEIGFPLRSRTYVDMLKNGFPGDDDTNYTFMASSIVENYGRDFTSEDVCDAWIRTQTINCYATAEKVAYRNIVAQYSVPDTAIYKNPFREWIGAQIRGDYFGYINPGDPEAAAEMAWRDARISHVKNGIYGEMFVAAMNAAAMVCDDAETVILCGMSQIPSTSRLYEKLQGVLDFYHSGRDWNAFFKDFQTRYDEWDKHDAVHTVSNAELVAAALLWGGGDYSKTICLAVQCGFDTDCNGATAGSIVGMMIGCDGIDKKWTDPIGGLVNTPVYNRAVPIDEFVSMMMRHMKTN
ncbi:MAG: helix-turn-helix domain-containing protein [Lachnospiraceae bacterium]|nr:helix-turn-helix domain-containing protein [Lachnospiraceae bacterium]